MLMAFGMVMVLLLMWMIAKIVVCWRLWCMTVVSWGTVVYDIS